MAISDAVIEAVRQRADLVELVAEHTRLKRSGRTFRGPCPLHGGEGPNFSVDPARGLFKCFVCGEGGDVFAFPMKHLGMDFLEAVRYVGARAGVEIPESGPSRPEAHPHAPLFEASAFAAEWFHRRLWDSPDGERARTYLQERGIPREVAERFGLGWAPDAWTAFGDAARAHGISDESLLEVGLLKPPKNEGSAPYDAFRGRLIFPIEDLSGRVIASGGRTLSPVSDFNPKYLNSPESPIYHKGRELYGLGWSRYAIRRAESALVVEGYMDYVSLAAHGIENVVAPLGTALTPEQAELLGRYADRAILLYDSDKAGLRATFRSGDELLRAGVEVLVATLPDGEDPDSLVRSKGARVLRRYLADAVDVLERKIQILERREYFGSISGTRRAIDALLPTIRAASDEVLRDVYFARLAEKTGVPRETLERELGDVSSRSARSAAARNQLQRATTRRTEDTAPPPAHVMGPERNLLLLLLADDSWIERTVRELGPEDFRHPLYRAIFEGVLHRDTTAESEEWLGSLSPEAISTVEELRSDPEVAHLSAPEEFFQANLRQILARPYLERLSEIDREFNVTPPEQHIPLMQKKEKILRTMRERKLPLSEGMLRRPPAA